MAIRGSLNEVFLRLSRAALSALAAYGVHPSPQNLWHIFRRPPGIVGRVLEVRGSVHVRRQREAPVSTRELGPREDHPPLLGWREESELSRVSSWER